MTKVYVLSSGDELDDYELHGIFSRYWKAVKARLILSVIEDKELNINEYELDELEKIYAEVQSRVYRWYVSAQKYSTIFKNDYLQNYRDWSAHRCGIDGYLVEFKDNWIVDTGSFYGGTVLASSEEEAIAKAEKLLKEQEENASHSDNQQTES